MGKFSGFILIFSFFSQTLASNDTNETATIRWVPFSSVDLKTLPPAAYSRGLKFYIGRAAYFDGIIPGKVWSATSGIHFVYKGEEIKKNLNYEVLVYPRGALKWVEVPRGDPLPPNLFQGGIQPVTKEPLYICRSWLLPSHQIIGKLIRSQTLLCRVASDWKENLVEEFDILVYNNNVTVTEEFTSTPATATQTARLTQVESLQSNQPQSNAEGRVVTGWIVFLWIVVALLMLSILLIMVYFRRQWSFKIVISVSASQIGTGYQLGID